MDYQTLKAEISGFINKGTLYDANIETTLREVFEQQERSQSFQYMRRVGDRVLGAGTYSIAVPRSGPQFKFKSLRFVQRLAPGGPVPIDAFDPEELSGRSVGIPRAHYLNGVTSIDFDRIASEDIPLRLGWNEVTVWPTGDALLTFEPWLFENAWSFLKWETILKMAPYLRDPELMQEVKPLQAAALKALQDLDYDQSESNKRYVMRTA